MKKILLLVLVTISGYAYSQVEIPKKMLKGVEVEVDEFDGSKIYTDKSSILLIEEKAEDYTLYFRLACSALDSPIELKKIYVLVNGKSTVIDANEANFTNKEVPQRRMKTAASGKFGTSSYKKAEFETRMNYIEEWKSEATDYMDLIKSIIEAQSFKVKFEGNNRDIVGNYGKSEVTRIKQVLDLFEYIKSQQ